MYSYVLVNCHFTYISIARNLIMMSSERGFFGMTVEVSFCSKKGNSNIRKKNEHNVQSDNNRRMLSKKWFSAHSIFFQHQNVKNLMYVTTAFKQSLCTSFSLTNNCHNVNSKKVATCTLWLPF